MKIMNGDWRVWGGGLGRGFVKIRLRLCKEGHHITSRLDNKDFTHLEVNTRLL